MIVITTTPHVKCSLLLNYSVMIYAIVHTYSRHNTNQQTKGGLKLHNITQTYISSLSESHIDAGIGERKIQNSLNRSMALST